MISACEDGQWEKAFDLFTELQQRNLEPDIQVYNALISACFKSKQWGKGNELFDEAKRRGLKL